MYQSAISDISRNRILRVRFFKKSRTGFLNPKETENGFCVSLLNRSIQDISDHGASKEPKKSTLFSKETQNPFSDSFGFKNPILDFLRNAPLVHSL